MLASPTWNCQRSSVDSEDSIDCGKKKFTKRIFFDLSEIWRRIPEKWFLYVGDGVVNFIVNLKTSLQ
jgi:hypothetical protein